MSRARRLAAHRMRQSPAAAAALCALGLSAPGPPKGLAFCSGTPPFQDAKPCCCCGAAEGAPKAGALPKSGCPPPLPADGGCCAGASNRSASRSCALRACAGGCSGGAELNVGPLEAAAGASAFAAAAGGARGRRHWVWATIKVQQTHGGLRCWWCGRRRRVCGPRLISLRRRRLNTRWAPSLSRLHGQQILLVPNKSTEDRML